MKFFLSILLLSYLPSSSFAQASKFFSLSFDVHLDVQGEFEHHKNGMITPVQRQFGYTIRIDPTNPVASRIFSDTLTYSTIFDSLFIVVDSARNNIVQFGWWHHPGGYDDTAWHFVAKELIINSDIVSLDSSKLVESRIDIAYSSGHAYITMQGPETDYYLLVRSKAANLSLNTSTSFVREAYDVRSFDITFDQSRPQCRFISSTKERVFELYTTLGSKIDGFVISPGETSVTLPPLPRGLYFIRLGESVIKAYIGE
jgi:hypothetical protein